MELINEHYVTYIPNRGDDIELMKQNAAEVFSLAKRTYANIGGIGKASNVEEFIDQYIESPKIGMWKLVKRGNKIVAGIIYRSDRGGRKAVYAFQDGTEQGKRDLAKIFNEDFKLTDRGSWAEASGKALITMLKQGAELVPSDVAKVLIDPDIQQMPDGYFYKRKLTGLGVKTKALVGFPPTDMKGTKLSTEDYNKFKELAIMYYEEDHNKEELTNENILSFHNFCKSIPKNNIV